MAKQLPLWRAEWYAGSQHRTAYVAAETFAAAASLIDPIVQASLAKDEKDQVTEQQPSVNTVRHGDVHFA
jgi:hypothetical protein